MCFNTQPPEGGWVFVSGSFCFPLRFNTQPPEGGWGSGFSAVVLNDSFNTQPPEGGWAFLYVLVNLELKLQHTAA